MGERKIERGGREGEGVRERRDGGKDEEKMKGREEDGKGWERDIWTHHYFVSKW